jgi:hypothetical protein
MLRAVQGFRIRLSSGGSEKLLRGAVLRSVLPVLCRVSRLGRGLTRCQNLPTM